MFVQMMDLRTYDRDGMAALEEEWRAETEGRQAMRRVLIGRDRWFEEARVGLRQRTSFDVGIGNACKS